MRWARHVKYGDDINAAWRVGRKQWKCRGRARWDHGENPPDHTETIEPGTLHLEYLEEAPAFESGPRWCEACARACGFY